MLLTPLRVTSVCLALALVAACSGGAVSSGVSGTPAPASVEPADGSAPAAPANQACEPLEDIPAMRGATVDFEAFSSDGPALMVISPPDYRVFFAQFSSNTWVEQHATVSVITTAVTVSFTNDGTHYTAYLPNKLSPPELGGPTLTADDGKGSVVRFPLTYPVPAIDFNLDGGTPFATDRPPPTPASTGTLGSTQPPTFLCF